MRAYLLSHLSDPDLLRDLAALVTRERATTADLLAHIAEVDARRLYAPEGFPSMFAYCVLELHLSEEAAGKRIHAARTARRFPAIFEAVADGRLHLSAVVMLAPHLNEETVDELLSAAAFKTKAEIDQLIASRFPRPDVPTLVKSVSPGSSSLFSKQPGSGNTEPSALEHAPGRVEAPAPRPNVAPLSPQRYAIHVTIGQSTHRKLRYAQDLLSHQIPSRDLAEVLDRALDALIRQLERSKFAATDRPRASRRVTAPGKRYVPAAVKRAVWERDGAQCTFVSEAGRRCPARSFLEFDHVDEIARGGRATVERMRLRCRAHNQYAAECTFGAGFMSAKRENARRGAEKRAAAEARAKAAAAQADEKYVVSGLRHGVRFDDARRAAAFCATIPDASLEERFRAALSFLYPRSAAQGRNRSGPLEHDARLTGDAIALPSPSSPTAAAPARPAAAAG